MTEHDNNDFTEKHWLNWCRLCAKDDVHGNIKVSTIKKLNIWKSVIKKHFDVDMRLKDELSCVCKECYSLISDLIDFAEHVKKAQAIFKVLQHAESSKQLDVEQLRMQYGLREENWTHVSKTVLEQVHPNEFNEVPKQEFIDVGECIESEPESQLEKLEESIVNHLTIDVDISSWDVENKNQDNPIKRQRGRRRTCRLSKTDSTEKIMKKECKEELYEAQEAGVINSDIDEKLILDADSDFLPESFETSSLDQEVHLSESSESEKEDVKTRTDDLDSSTRRRQECKWCSKVYRNPVSYQKHMRLGCRKIKQRRKGNEVFSCELCDKVLSSASALKVHKQGMHDNVKAFVCDNCGKQLKTISALNQHKKVHSDDRPFGCTICSARFKKRNSLKVHSQTHDEPSFECNICGKKMQTSRTLISHKLVHSDDRKFKCDVCDAVFKRSKTLKQHLLSHTGLRPYVCNYCGKTFACNANCRSHKLKNHRQEIEREEPGEIPSRLKIPTLNELRAMSQKLPKIKADFKSKKL